MSRHSPNHPRYSDPCSDQPASTFETRESEDKYDVLASWVSIECFAVTVFL